MLPVLAAALIASAACTSNTTSSDTSATSVGSVLTLKADLDRLHACDLVDGATLDKDHLTKQGSPPDNGCDWSNFDSGVGGSTFGLHVNIMDSEAVESSDALTDVTVGKHKAKQSPNSPLQTCTIEIAVSLTARVDVRVTAGNTIEACETANRFANVVEPKLP